MSKAKKEKRTLGILAGSGDDSDDPGEDPSRIQINEDDYARRDEAPPQRLEERREEGLKLPASEESSDVEEDDDESSEEDDAIIASRRVDRRVFEAIRRIRNGGDGGVNSSEDEVDEEDLIKHEKRKINKEKLLYLKDVNARHLLDEGTEATAQTGRSSKYDRIAYDGEHKKGLEAFTSRRQEKEGEKDKSGKQSRTDREGPISSEPDNDAQMNEQEETDVKRKSTRSARRKRRDGDLKMSTKRKVAYGIIKPKRPKNH